jgi:hypothetical protein
MKKITLARETWLWQESRLYVDNEKLKMSWWDGYRARKKKLPKEPPTFLTGEQIEAWLNGYNYREEIHG